MKMLSLPCTALLASAPALAADLDMMVRDAAGKPVRDAVVMVYGAGAKPGPARFPWPARVTQQDIQFDPYVLIVPVGAAVSFPNRDRVRHHVYSFSKPKKFELKLYGREENRTVTFDKAGAVAIGCNIHDNMQAFVRVVDTPWAAKTDASGRAAIGGLPAGQARIVVWHPDARAKDNEVAVLLSLPRAGRASGAVRLNLAAGRRP